MYIVYIQADELLYEINFEKECQFLYLTKELNLHDKEEALKTHLQVT